jgi:hypothetical protein
MRYFWRHGASLVAREHLHCSPCSRRSVQRLCCLVVGVLRGRDAGQSLKEDFQILAENNCPASAFAGREPPGTDLAVHERPAQARRAHHVRDA